MRVLSHSQPISKKMAQNRSAEKKPGARRSRLQSWNSPVSVAPLARPQFGCPWPSANQLGVILLVYGCLWGLSP